MVAILVHGYAIEENISSEITTASEKTTTSEKTSLSDLNNEKKISSEITDKTTSSDLNEMTQKPTASDLERKKRNIGQFIGLLLMFADDDEDEIFDISEKGIDMSAAFKETVDEEVDAEIKKAMSFLQKTRSKRNIIPKISSKFLNPTIIFLMQKWRSVIDKMNQKEEKNHNKTIIVRPEPNNNSETGKAVSISRQKRNGGVVAKIAGKVLKNLGKKALKTTGSIAKWGGIWVIGSAGSKYVEKKMDQADENDLDDERAAWDCHKNNYGCMRGYCWTNCGPRVKKGDYCLTSHNPPKNASGKVELIECTLASQCANCLPCGTPCVYSTDIIQVEKDDAST